MPGFRVAFAVVAGALLYYVAVVLLGGVLAAVAIPKSYFDFFGRERVELALALLSLASWALPVLVAVFLGAFLTLRVVRGCSRPCSWALALGMLGCFLYWQASFALFMASQPASALSFGQAFASTLLPVWWAAPSMLAPWAGLALAVWVSTKRLHGSAPREV